jgi:F-type H+-transporting ATPase subunit b
VDRTQGRWRESLQRQKESFLHDLRRRAGEQVFHVARKVLKDLADEELEKYIVESFCRRLRDLGKKKKEEINESLEGVDHEAVVLSRFQMPKKFQQKVEKAIKESGGEDARVKFKTSEDLIGGIELEIGDRKVAWGIDTYLAELEEDMSEAFEQKMAEEKTEEKEHREESSKKEEKKSKKQNNQPKKKKEKKKQE